MRPPAGKGQPRAPSPSRCAAPLSGARDGILEEVPEAYKDVDEVIEVVHTAGLARKVARARDLKGGLRFIVVLAPCLDGWGLQDNAGPKTSRLAVESGVFPLYEVEGGDRYTLNYGRKGIPVSDYTSVQKRYRHLSPQDVELLQDEVDRNWERLKLKF